MATPKPPAQPEEPALLPEVQKAFWLPGDLNARLLEILAQRKKAGRPTTEKALLAEAVKLLVAASDL